jgi:ADP-Ribosyltransferase in polyvalent proteins
MKTKKARRHFSASFKAWFGNSKVICSKGRPKVAYHGLDGEDFSSFKPGASGLFGGGIYFASCPGVAEIYTKSGDSDGARIIPVYLALQNPLKTVANYDDGDAYDFDSPAIALIKKLLPEKIKEIIAKSQNNYRHGELDFDIRDAAQALGYDGIEIHWPGRKRRIDYLVFDPFKVKSAVGNNGKFDPENQDICA